MTDSRGWNRARWLGRCLAIAAGLVGAYLLWDFGRLWLIVWWTGLESADRRGISIAFLHGVLILYGVALVLAGAAAVGSATRVFRGRRCRERRPFSAKVLALSVATLFGLGMLELGAWGFTIHRNLPPSPPAVPPLRVPGAAGSDELSVLVVGESSAEGQPFQPWFSIGHAVARELERASPGRKVRLVMTATGGVPLARALAELELQTRRPDVVVMYSGHNEFQSRWSWQRGVNYYGDDVAKRPRDELSDYVGDWTAFTNMIRDAVDLQRIDQPPPPKEVRAVVDRPVCEPETRADICRLFARELEMAATWCERAGAVPIFVLPAGNDVGFDPDRSILAPETPAIERAAFAEDFLAARALEAHDPKAAARAYRLLIARQPGFAEAHYRLARWLQAEGRIDEAREHYTLARDLDGMPMRCPSEFQQAYRDLAPRHSGLILIDAPARLEAISPTKLLDDNVFHDGQHPTFRAYLALAQDAVDQLRERGLFGLDLVPSVPINPDETAAHFKLDAAKWIEVCGRSASFWARLSTPRYDGSDRIDRVLRFNGAATAIQEGAAPEDVDVPGLGVHPPGFP